MLKILSYGRYTMVSLFVSRYKSFQKTPNANENNITLLSQNLTISGDCDNRYSNIDLNNGNNIEIPIVGYEIMEERARFTVCISIVFVSLCSYHLFNYLLNTVFLYLLFQKLSDTRCNMKF